MFLKKLQIKGFKSFAKETILEFEPGIVSIVGPNGSGKSNLADSLRWVFGEQSMKLLRGKKSEDVIFAGSDQKSRMGLAEVLVYFDNQDHQMPVDYDEVVIGRRLHRDGTSEYLLNNNQVRLLDIQDLLGKTGFGHSSYHVVGQGMIDQLILGGPAAVKELIEEAAGVKPYYVKRERTLRRLLTTETNLEQAKLLVKEIEPRLRSLRRQTKRLEKRTEVEQELKEALSLYYGQLFSGLEKSEGELAGRIKLFDKQIADLGKEIDNLNELIQRQEGTMLAAKEDQFSKLRKELEKFRKEKLSLLEEQAVLRGKMQVRTSVGTVPQINWREVRDGLKNILSRLQKLFQDSRSLSNDRAAWQDQAQSLEQDFSRLVRDLEEQSDSDVGGKGRLKHEEQLKTIGSKIEKLDELIKNLELKMQEQVAKQSEEKKQFFEMERSLRRKQDALLKTRDQKNQLSVEQARLMTQKENYEVQAREELGNNFKEVLVKPSGPLPAGLTEKISRLKKDLSNIGGVDDLTIQEHRETEKRYGYLTDQSADLEKAVSDLKTAIDELDQVIKQDFDEAFAQISKKFGEYFRVLFGGGRATMSVIREKPRAEEEDFGEEIEEELREKKRSPEIVGIAITATPPGKKLATVSALSGGERALTSIALLSSLLATYPSPFVVLDEVDAALDEANSIRFGKIIATLADKTQFITITHNRETMRQSHTLYGVTMGDDGVSRLLSLKLEEAAVYSTKD